MRKILLLLMIFALAAGSASAQLANSKDANSIKGRKLALVPLGGSTWEGASPAKIEQMKQRFLEAVSTHWTFTNGEPEVITGEEAKQLQKKKDTGYVILKFDHLPEEKKPATETHQERAARKSALFTMSDDYLSSILTLELPEQKGFAYRFEMPAMWPEEGHFATGLMEMQDYLTAQLPKDNPRSQMNGLKQNGNLLKTKTLLVNEQDLESKLTEADIKKAYPYSLKIVPYSKIEEAVLSKDPGFVYVQLAPTSWYYPEGVTHRIYDAETGKIVALTMGQTSKINAKHFKYYQHYVKK